MSNYTDPINTSEGPCLSSILSKQMEREVYENQGNFVSNFQLLVKY